MADDDLTIFAQYAPGSFEIEGSKVSFGVKAVRKTYKGDVIKHRRLYQNGARLDHMGGDANGFVLLIEFYNDAADPDAPNAYPDDCNALEKLLESQKTGWLNVPTHGPVRAKCESYDRVEEDTSVDSATINASFIVDSEDDQTAGSFTAPTASSVASRYAIDWQEESGDAGVDSDPFGEIEDFCDDLSELARAPENFIASFEARASQVVNAIARVERSYSQAAESGSGEVVALLTQPGSSRAVMKGRRLADTIASGASTAVEFTVVRYPVIVSIYDVARDVQQDASRLIAINADIPDLMQIEAKEPIRILAA